MRNNIGFRVLLCALSLPLALTVTGCSVSSPLQKGSINLSADAEGMRAFGDTLNGLITNGKESPDKVSAHWLNRKNEEREITTRELKPSFLDGLFAPKGEEQGS